MRHMESAQRGAVMVIVVAGLVAIIGMAGLALDLAHAYTNKTQLQNALDAAALERGMSPFRAAIEGAQQIGFTVLSISISLVAAFIPLLFMSGLVGRVFREFSVTLAFAIAVSTVVSLTLTPMICAHFVRAGPSPDATRLDRLVERGLGMMMRFYARTLGTVLRHRGLTLFVFAAVGWLSSAHLAGRVGAFLLAFGVWDLMYYAVLWLVIGWPDSLAAWDILFLIPVAWVAPVWAPVVVAVIFVATGSWLFLTDDRPRTWRGTDLAIIVAACTIIVASFLVESAAAAEHRVPERYAWWLYWPGVALGVAWFVRVERRSL